ncbi:MAG: hypothetical protein ABW133_21910 [Polyangiaceae bacterium]
MNLRAIVFLGLLLGACRNGSAPSPVATAPASDSAASAGNAGAPEITSDPDAGIPKLIFAVTNYETKDAGVRSVTLAGKHQGQPVGLQMLIGPTGTSSRFKTVAMQRAQVTLRRTGDEGDRFLNALADLYGMKGAAARKLKPETIFTSFSVAGDSDKLAAGPVKLKLVVQGASESDLAELLVDLDVNAHLAHLDASESHREALIRALTAP